jgi:aryl-alcohol dehydrogenase-like predicted oxidoreductase
MKIGLGTVQFGLDYGVSNKSGKTTADEAIGVLEAAAQHGIRVIDTATLYGDSEEVLGKALPEEHAFDLITKTPRLAETGTSQRALVLEQTFQRSLRNLRAASVYGLLIHHADDLLAEGADLLMDWMIELKRRGLVKKVGVSVYNANQIDRVLERFTIDLIQLPVNVLDQRLLLSGHLARLKAAGVEIHARSAFLQGLLLMDPAAVPPYFDPIRRHLTDYHKSLRLHGITPVQAALGFVTGLDEIDVVICGVNNRRQLEEICSNQAPLSREQFARFAIADEAIVNPSRWTQRI